MALNLAKLTQTGMAAATKAGVTASITITRPVPPPDPLTGVQSGAAVSQTVDAVQAQGRKSAKAGDAAWSSVRTALFVAARDTTFTPLRGDLVAFAGKASRIEAIDEYAPSGTVIGWFLGIGA